MIRLTAYTKMGCGLCEDMLSQLYQLQQQYSYDLEIVEIDEEPVLEHKFGAKVPVLVAGDDEICHYFLDVDRLDEYILGKS